MMKLDQRSSIAFFFVLQRINLIESHGHACARINNKRR